MPSSSAADFLPSDRKRRPLPLLLRHGVQVGHRSQHTTARHVPEMAKRRHVARGIGSDDDQVCIFPLLQRAGLPIETPWLEQRRPSTR
jgi:hypothetical protein